MPQVSRGNLGFQEKGSLLCVEGLAELGIEIIHTILGYLPTLFAAALVLVTSGTISYFLFRIFYLTSKGVNLVLFQRSPTCLPSDAFYATFGAGASVPFLWGLIWGLEILGIKIPHHIFGFAAVSAELLFIVGAPVLIFVRSMQFLTLMVEHKRTDVVTTQTNKPAR